MVAALAMALVLASVPHPARADSIEERPPTPAIFLGLVDGIAIVANTADVLQSRSTTFGGGFGIAAGAVTLGYAAYLGTTEDSGDAAVFMTPMGAMSVIIGIAAITSRDASPLSLQPQRILGETAVAVAFTHHF